MHVNLKSLLRTYRRKSDELLTSLTAVSSGELVRGIVQLFTAGELRLYPRKRTRTRSLIQRFYRYDRANQWVGEWFLRTAQAKRDAGRTHYAIGNLLEKLRHDVARGVIKTDRFHIANEYQSCYVRQILMRDSTLCGMFELQRTSNADSLVVDGRTWADFAKEHEAELWPERTKKNGATAGQSELPLDEKTA
jgi:hypothetical protein